VSRNILIAGSGKIARDTGMFFLKKGHAVSWVSANESRLMELQAWVDKSVRIFMKYSGGAVRQVSACFYLYEELERGLFDVIIECARESLEEKRLVISYLEKYVNNTLLLTVSSSVLPSAIHPACAGFHVFFPLELTKTAEIILPASVSPHTRDAVLSFCSKNGITGILQTEKTAFAVNRLLLPLQNEVFCALKNGIGADDVNGASSSPLFPAGQLDFIRKVGPAVVKASVENYRARMNPGEDEACVPLSKGLGEMVGSRERKPQGKKLGPQEFDTLRNKLYYLFINTCFGFLGRKEISQEDLGRVLDSVFGAEIGFDEAVGKEGKKNIIHVLEEAYMTTKADYYKPAESLRKLR
jgi:3-hydroxyacyl-CoA dehydrogenase